MSETAASTAGGPVPDGERRVSVALALGILLMPLLFAWFTLRPGYTYWARRFSIGYAMVVLLAIIAVGALLFSMRGYIAQGQSTFDEFRVQRQLEHEARMRNSTDPNGPGAHAS